MKDHLRGSIVRHDALPIDRDAPGAARSAEANTKLDRPVRASDGGAFRRSSPQGTVRGSVTTRMLTTPDPAPRDELPIVTVRDVSSWPGLVVVCIAAAVYLAWSTTTDHAVGDLELIAWGVLLLTPTLALIGSRELRLYEDSLVVIRRGKVRLDRRLEELLAVRSIPFTGVHWAVFRGPVRVVLFSSGPAWQRLVESCKRCAARTGGLREP